MVLTHACCNQWSHVERTLTAFLHHIHLAFTCSPIENGYGTTYMVSANVVPWHLPQRTPCRERRFGSLGLVESDCMNATCPPRRLLYRLVAIISALVIASGVLSPLVPAARAQAAAILLISEYL